MNINRFSKSREENDFYSTPPEMIDYLLKYESFDNHIWEPCCGNGSLVNRLKELGYNVKSSDIIKRIDDAELIDLLQCSECFDGDIITNPPYKNCEFFVKKCYELCKHKCALFLNIHFLEGQQKYDYINKDCLPKTIYLFIKRVQCFKEGVYTKNNSSICYAWFVYEKDFKGNTNIILVDNRKK